MVLAGCVRYSDMSVCHRRVIKVYVSDVTLEVINEMQNFAIFEIDICVTFLSPTFVRVFVTFSNLIFPTVEIVITFESEISFVENVSFGKHD